MLFNLSPHNCIYRGEGNKTVVISLRKEKKVIRLKKYDADTEVTHTLEQEKKILENQVLIIKNVLKPVLGENLINSPVLIYLEKEDMKVLNEYFNSMRPKNRMSKEVKEEDTYAVMLPDYCTLPPDLKIFSPYGPVLSIEIKPKQGFLCQNVYFTSPVPCKQLLKCRFCMMQYLKIKRNLISSKSEYCPTDLFSGCFLRMKHALQMLLDTPRNNMRIFKNQELIFSDEKRSDLNDSLLDFFGDIDESYTDVLCSLVIEILLKPFHLKVCNQISILENAVLQKCSNAYPGCSEDGSCHRLPVSCVLHSILCLQMLENLNIRDLHSLYSEVKENQKETNDRFLDSIGCYSRSEIPPHFGEKHQVETESDYEYASRKVWEFLLAVIFQDCSIMIVLKRYNQQSDESLTHNIVRDILGNTYLFSCAVVDLDAKPMEVVEKRYKETPHLIQACSSTSV